MGFTRGCLCLLLASEEQVHAAADTEATVTDRPPPSAAAARSETRSSNFPPPSVYIPGKTVNVGDEQGADAGRSGRGGGGGSRSAQLGPVGPSLARVDPATAGRSVSQTRADPGRLTTAELKL